MQLYNKYDIIYIGGEEMKVKRVAKKYVNIPPVRVDEEDLKKIDDRAAALNLKRSEYVRYCLSKEMNEGGCYIG